MSLSEIRMSNREANIRRTDEIVSKVISFWPLWVTLAGGVVTAINMYEKFNEMVAEQRAFKASVEDRRTKTHDEMELVRTRITRLEQWKDDTETNRKNGGSNYDRQNR